MTSFITINDRKIGYNSPPYIIAELSANHNGDINKALKIIKEAKQAGADAVKIQTYTPDTITINCHSENFQIHGGLWDGLTLYELYKKAYTPWEWHKSLFDYAQKLGITIFSSPFDFTAVDLLEDLQTPAYKVASFEIVDLPLIKYIAQTHKPMIISTGMANDTEILEAVETAKEGGCKQIAILHCVSSYPAEAKDYNLRTLVDMQQRFSLPTGLSDHTLSNTTAITAVALGACIIEKHFTLDRNNGGPDDSFSLETKDFTALCQETRTAWEALGEINYGRKKSEQGNIKFRRSLYAVKDIKKGDLFTHENIRSIRPGNGIAPKYLDSFIGKTAKEDINFGTPLQLKMF
jgi:N-acetylneuraminate synthase